MKSKPSSWKEKVDPAFDIIIRKFVKFFDSVELISNTGWLVLNEEYLKNFCKVQHGWILNYEKEMNIRDISGRVFPISGSNLRHAFYKVTSLPSLLIRFPAKTPAEYVLTITYFPFFGMSFLL
jgi:hypothetical protein